MSKNSKKIEVGSNLIPNYLLNYLNSNEVKTIKQGSQQDSQEFLGWILEELNNELLKSYEENGTNEPDLEWEEVGKKNKKSQIREFKQQESSITEIFGGKIRSSIKKRNSKPILSMEPFFTLHLPITSSVNSLEDSFALLTSFEDLNEGYSKQLTIEELPNVLILHMERFTYNKETQTIQKISKNIKFSQDMYLNTNVVSKTKIPENDVGRNYNLYSVICHHGKEATGGHYTTYVYHPCDKWIHFDDTTVSIVPISQVLKQQAYLLIYVKK